MGATGPAGSSGPNVLVSDFQCVIPQIVDTLSNANPAPLLFQPSTSGVNFDGGVLTSGSQFNAFVFAQGSYTIQLFGFGINQTPAPSSAVSFIALTASPPVMISNSEWVMRLSDVDDLEIVPSTMAITVPTNNTVIQFNLLAESLPQGTSEITLYLNNQAANGFPAEPEVGCNLLITKVM
jgi:hypothetical protein